MQSSNHCRFGDARNQAFIARCSRCDPQRMAIQTSFAKKVIRSKDAHDRFLAVLRNDGELYFAPLDVKNRVRFVALRKNNLAPLIFGYRFPIAHFGEKCFRLESGLLNLLHEDCPSWTKPRGVSDNRIALPTPELNIRRV